MKEDLIHNETIDNILSRQTVREYKKRELSLSELNTLLAAAIQAPSGRNSQPCHARALINAELLEELNTDFKNTVGWDTPAYTRWDTNPVYHRAPCMFFIFSHKNNPALIDSGIMVENLALAAKGLGLDSVIIASVGALFEGKYKDKWKTKLNIDSDFDFRIAIAIGEGDEKPEPKPRSLDHFAIIK